MIETLKQINLKEFMSKCWMTEFKREGSHYVALSPFREESTPSVYVTQKRDGHWVFIDHGSDVKGSIIDAVMARDEHQDVGVAIETAKRMAMDVGLLARSCPEPPSEDLPRAKLDTLFKKFCGNDIGSVREYLVGRGLADQLVDDLIARKVVLRNHYEESDYCCLAVRDAEGDLRTLFNPIKGPAPREKFLIGEQHVFCSDWSQVAQASQITICEGIIDALSMETLHGGCVLAIPGANFDLKRLPDLQADAYLVEAFDADQAGRAAAERLEKQFPGHPITNFDLQGAQDVNALLCDGKKVTSGQKLSLENRVDIALSGKPSREQAAISGVHHSRVCDIRKDATETLTHVWEQRRPGRPAKPSPSPEVQALQLRKEAMTREMELLQMRNDYLELNLKMQSDRAKAVAGKKKSPEEVKQMIELVEQHAVTYPHHRVRDRLKQVELTEESYWRLRNNSYKQTVRESAIPEADLVAAINFFTEHPDVGAGKAHATLIAEGKAWISVATLNQIKHELAAATALGYKKRDEAKKLLEAQLRKDLAARKKSTYVHMKATYPHHIWAIDFVNIIFMGMHFVICAIYDEYSQEYPAIKVGVAGDQHLAADAFQEALVQASTKPVWLRRDNGKAFETELFQKQLETTEDYPIPPHSPWFNGGLESCNGSLKAAVKTTGMQKMAIDPTFFRQVRQDTDLALEALGDIISDVRIMLNQDIARLRLGMTPAQVISGEEEARAKQEAFITWKREERKKRMAAIRKNPERNPKTLIAKTKTLVKRVINKLETDSLYVLNEVLHHRFRMFET